MKRLWTWLFGSKPHEPAAARLRNKPGGMAYIRGLGEVPGSDSLNGRIVQTVSADAEGFWTVEPAQSFTATVPLQCRGHLFWTGDAVPILSFADGVLVPLQDPGQDERDESAAWLPPVPAGLPTIADTRVPNVPIARGLP